MTDLKAALEKKIEETQKARQEAEQQLVIWQTRLAQLQGAEAALVETLKLLDA